MFFFNLFYIKMLVVPSTIIPSRPSTVPNDINSIGSLTTKLWWYLTQFLWLGATIASLLLLYAVFMLVTSLGDSGKYEKAKKTLIHFGIGWFIITISYTLVKIAIYLFQ